MSWRYATILLVSFSAVSNTAAAEWTGYVVATSDYVYRGASQSDGDPALQVGIDGSFRNGVFVGAWASTVDLESPITARDTELRLYLGYGFDIGDRYRLTVSAIAYRYPGSEGPVDYDNEEISASLGYNDTIWVEYAYSSDLYNSGWDTHNLEVFAERALPRDWTLSGGAGLYRVDNQASSDTTYWNIGVSRPFRLVDVDARYHHADDWIPFISNDELVGSRFALSIRYSF